MKKQKTILGPAECRGIGVHSGQETKVTFKPAEVDNGIVIVRTDVSSVDNKISASYENVCDTRLSTSVKNDAGVFVSTIEHMMAGIWGCGIDNLIIEIDAPEVPIMDGSSRVFVEMIHKAGIKTQHRDKKTLHLLKDIEVIDGPSTILAKPSEKLHVDIAIDFEDKVIGKQNHVFHHADSFKNDVGNARTFGFLKDLEYLQSKGLAKGTSLENTVGIDDQGIMNKGGLRYSNEFARHKMLDFFGDFFCCGGGFILDLKGYKTSHNLNNVLLQKIFEDPGCYKWK
ncbi:MAG: hypothetical protein DGJ47_000480 [Rickettsiaceae bacterium]